jgi:uncharacterized membrane protein YesL
MKMISLERLILLSLLGVAIFGIRPSFVANQVTKETSMVDDYINKSLKEAFDFYVSDSLSHPTPQVAKGYMGAGKNS